MHCWRRCCRSYGGPRTAREREVGTGAGVGRTHGRTGHAIALRRRNRRRGHASAAGQVSLPRVRWVDDDLGRTLHSVRSDRLREARLSARQRLAVHTRRTGAALSARQRTGGSGEVRVHGRAGVRRPVTADDRRLQQHACDTEHARALQYADEFRRDVRSDADHRHEYTSPAARQRHRDSSRTRRYDGRSSRLCDACRHDIHGESGSVRAGDGWSRGAAPAARQQRCEKDRYRQRVRSCRPLSAGAHRGHARHRDREQAARCGASRVCCHVRRRLRAPTICADSRHATRAQDRQHHRATAFRRPAGSGASQRHPQRSVSGQGVDSVRVLEASRQRRAAHRRASGTTRVECGHRSGRHGELRLELGHQAHAGEAQVSVSRDPLEGESVQSRFPFGTTAESGQSRDADP